MGLILDTSSPTCAGHQHAEIDALVSHVESVYARFYASQLAFINSNLRPAAPLLEIDDADQEPLDHLDAYLPTLSWTLPGYSLSGAGAYRVVIPLCSEHVLKINPGEINHNALEAEAWFSVPDNLLPLFVPVIAVAPGAEPRWLIAARAEPLAITPENDEMALSIGLMIGSIEDLHAANLGRLHGSLVLLDYGHSDNDLESLRREFAHDLYPVELVG
jgi:hypothetical protein